MADNASDIQWEELVYFGHMFKLLELNLFFHQTTYFDPFYFVEICLVKDLTLLYDKV